MNDFLTGIFTTRYTGGDMDARFKLDNGMYIHLQLPLKAATMTV